MTKEERFTSNYRWALLALIALSSMLTIAMPSSALSVLFDEIRQDIGLSIVQIGVIWSVSSFTGLLMALPGGLLSDRFGPRTMLTIIFIVGGFFSLLRGFTTSYIPFLLTSFVFGIFLATAGLNMIKVVTGWFSPAERGMATGVFSAGFAGGFLIGSFSAATYLSPWLGGWPNVFFLFGGLSILIGIAWFVLYPKLSEEETLARQALTLRESTIDPLKQVLLKPNLWIIAVAKLGFLGCVRGFSGYLPLYLRGQGWLPTQADYTISLFYLFSLIFVIPLSIYSDRVGRRRPFLVVLTAVLGLAVLGVPLTGGWVLILCVILAGLTFDAVMGLSVAAVTEVKGVGAALASTAVGLTFMIQQLGGTLAPIIGNSLESYSPQAPFYFWGGMALAGSLLIAFMSEEKRLG
ncbi:MAG: nitrate/nitrite transporter [Anaerolineae bacterium]